MWEEEDTCPARNTAKKNEKDQNIYMTNIRFVRHLQVAARAAGAAAAGPLRAVGRSQVVMKEAD